MACVCVTDCMTTVAFGKKAVCVLLVIEGLSSSVRNCVGNLVVIRPQM